MFVERTFELWIPCQDLTELVSFTENVEKRSKLPTTLTFFDDLLILSCQIDAQIQRPRSHRRDGLWSFGSRSEPCGPSEK